MRVVVVIKTNHGGMWTLPQIDELRRRGHAVSVVLPAGAGRLRRALDARDVPVVESMFSFRFVPGQGALTGLLGLRRQLVALAPDVIFFHLYASALAVRLASTGLGASKVHMVAGPLYLESGVIRAAERVLVKLDTVTICGSEFTATAYRALGRRAQVTPAIPYGVDTSWFRPLDHTVARVVRAELDIDDAAFVAVLVAYVYAPKRSVHRGHGIKGHSVLLDAWSVFHCAHPGSHLIIVGSGIDAAAEQYRRSLLNSYGLPAPESGVTWITTTDDVRRYYAAADVSVSPSLSENHGAALEAGAMGVPSIVSDAGALPETVTPASGWVVPRGNVAALVSALRSAHREHALGQLTERGRCARTFITGAFELSRSSAAVADVIEAAGRADTRTRTYSVFCEARFGRGANGGWAAVDGVGSWDRYLRFGCGLRVAARADQQFGTGTVPLPAELRLVPLPYYVGVRQLAAHAVRLAGSIALAVRTADVIVLRLPGVIGSLAAAACLLMRRRYAVEVVGDPREVLAAGVLGRGGKLAASAAGMLTRWVVRRADAVLYATKEQLQRRYPPGPRSRVAGLANVVLGPDAYLTQSRRWISGRARIVAIGSQEQHYKGHDVLLRAVRQLIDRGVDVDAVIVGGGRMHGQIQALLSSLGLDDRVTLTGVINDRAHLIEVLDGASVFAMPSRTEGLPRALVEAMARGLPAVGTDVGGIPELLEPRWIVPPDDDHALAEVIAELLSDPEQWEAQSRRSLDVAGGYRAEDLQKQFDDWLRTVPAARSRPLQARQPHDPGGPRHTDAGRAQFAADPVTACPGPSR